jgi:hypothetical protein
MIKIFRESVFPETAHQHGWNEVLRHMRAHLHQQVGAPAFLDDFVDISFGDNIADPGIPYRHPWVGIIHHPMDIPAADPALALKSTRTMMAHPKFKESLKCCKGLITFSPSNAREIRKVLAEQGTIVPVFRLVHPTETNVPLFSWEIFEQTREINCVGFWLRRLHTFAELRTDLKKRYIFSSHRVEERMAHLRKCLDGSIPKDIVVVPYLDHDDYNHALATGIGFADYIACCASNTLLEHIVRGTPILVNRVPSVIDYLEPMYPLFYADRKEAEDKLRDMGCVKAAHEYLVNRSKQPMFRYDWFIESMKSVLKKIYGP